MAGTLFVVATPIGHLEDISARALRVLGEAAVVAAEDTRRTGNLLRHFGIPTRILSLHQHNERSRAPELVTRLRRGESVAMVSDAGTPGISDPGAELVRLAREQGFRVEAVPGPSAVAAAMSLSGTSHPYFAFLGFPPVRSKDRKFWLSRLDRLRKDVTIVFFEAPHRIRKTLEALIYIECPIMVFREMTKWHEETLSGTPCEVLKQLTSIQGEFTIVIPAMEVIENEDVAVSDELLTIEVGQLIENLGCSRREAARTVGERYGLSTKRVYDATKG
ncbi:MAG: 16S rRNA (cytidine(1402)-2'-O)-methyltransferase [Acidobacteriota bacterium]|nr:16S rRNA (cytidine(1402)-2'-O)-methyltransferase [Acidobacteriota bacterium]